MKLNIQFNLKAANLDGLGGGAYVTSLTGTDDILVDGAVYTIKMMRGEEEISGGFKFNDLIHFEMMDDNNTIIPLTFEGQYGGETLSFIDGISDEVKFTEKTDLVIPAIGGFEEEDFRVFKKKSSWTLWLYIGSGVLIILIIIIVIANKSGKSRSKIPSGETKMSFKLPQGEQ